RKTDGRGNSLVLAYDSLNRVISATDALNATWHYTRDAYGNVTHVTDPMGRQIREDTYDKLNRKVSSTDGLGNQLNYRYDAVGNLLSTYLSTVLSFTESTLRDDPDSNGIATGLQVAQWTNRDDTGTVTAAIEDGAQKLTVSNHGAGADGAAYDYVGTVGRTDAKLRWAAAAGDVYSLSVDYRQSGGDYAQFIAYYYAADGTLLDSDYGPAFTRTSTWKRQAYTAMAAPAGTAFMGLRIVFRTNGAEPSETMNGAMWARYLQVEKGIPSTGPREYTYDLMNRMTGITAAGGVNVALAYDAAGNRTSMTDGTGGTAYTYDKANHLLSKTAPDTRSIAYEYNPLGKVSKVTDYAGNSTQYTYDKVGRVDSATFAGTSTAGFTYDAAGNRKTLTLPGGVATSYDYDAANRLTSLVSKNGGGAALKSYGYEYDAANNLTSKTDAAGKTGYSYDKDNQLITVAQPSGTTQYDYDPAGNRTVMTDGTGTTTYTYNGASRLTQVAGPSGTDTYVSDKSGNQVSDGKSQYEYDGLNRLTGVTTATDTVAYEYDGDGMLIGRTAGSGTTRFYLDGKRVINEGDGSGAITAAMFRGGGLNLGRKVGANPTAYYLYNGHGDVTGMLDAAGASVAAYDYDAFGKLTTSTGSFDNPYLYAGEYYDYTTTQYYLRSRFYNPQLGRFISQDTDLGKYDDPLSLHLYTYVKNNPMTYVDPTGHWPDWLDNAVEAVTDFAQDAWKAATDYVSEVNWTQVANGAVEASLGALEAVAGEAVVDAGCATVVLCVPAVAAGGFMMVDGGSHVASGLADAGAALTLADGWTPGDANAVKAGFKDVLGPASGEDAYQAVSLAANMGGAGILEATRMPAPTTRPAPPVGEDHNVVNYMKYKEVLRASEAANPAVDSLRATGQLPSGYVTKAQAQAAGWAPGKAVGNFVPGAQIGGDVYRNSTGVVPAAPGRAWFEADVGLSNMMSRGNQPGWRLLFSNDGHMYISPDHYETPAHYLGTYK
ncbi:MAG TPA: RHS repeat-associated core domain-containing protein, partial [Symbiobacteriaceae bacterium]